MVEPVNLIADRVRYFHENDEALFFVWLDRMEVVSGYEGHRDELHIWLARYPSEDDLRELIALHRHYTLDIRRLAAFRTPEIEDWFAAPEMYFNEAVFGPGLNRPVSAIADMCEIYRDESLLQGVRRPIVDRK